MTYIPLSPNADIQTAAQLDIFLKLSIDSGLELVNSANVFAAEKFSNNQIGYYISLLEDYDPNQKIIRRNGALLTPTNETVNFLKSGGFINSLYGKGLTSIEKNCNRLLGFLANYTEDRYLGYSDNEIKGYTYLSQNELESAISKLKRLGYAGGGKTSTTLEDEGREFWEKGGFSPTNNDTNSISPIISNTYNFQENKGQVAIGDNAKFGDINQDFSNDNTSSISEEELKIAKKNLFWAKVGTISAISLTLIGWLLSHYKIWPFG